MHVPSLLLLLGAAGAIAIAHSILPDHWVPLAVVARTQRWSITRVARISALASLGHVIASLVLGGSIALIGLQFQHEVETQQGHITGGILVLTGLGFLLWGLVSGGQGHRHSGEGHTHGHNFGQGHHSTGKHEQHHHHHEHGAAQTTKGIATQQTLAGRLAAIAVPFGVAASPDVTILPVALAASAVSGGAVVGVLSVFALLTMGTFIGLTVLATVAGYQMKGAWFENNATTITSLVLIAIGVVAFIGF